MDIDIDIIKYSVRLRHLIMKSGNGKTQICESNLGESMPVEMGN